MEPLLEPTNNRLVVFPFRHRTEEQTPLPCKPMCAPCTTVWRPSGSAHAEFHDSSRPPSADSPYKSLAAYDRRHAPQSGVGNRAIQAIARRCCPP